MFYSAIINFLSLFGLVSFYVTPGVHHQPGMPSISDTATYYYGSFALPDSAKKIFAWKDMADFRVTAGGPVYFDFKSDSVIIQRSGRGAILHYTYKRLALNDNQKKKVPQSLLNNSYSLLGVFYEPAEKGNGLFTAYYSNGKSLLAVWYEGVVGFVIGANYFTATKVNDFKEANFNFPFVKKIRF